MEEKAIIAEKAYKIKIGDKEFNDLEEKDNALILAIQELTKQIRRLANK